MKKILITGHNGFIGKHLKDYFQSKKVELILPETDARSPLEDAPSADIVYHLGAVVKLDRFKADPVQSYEINFMGTLRVLEYCRRCSAKLILPSTSGVYGNQNQSRVKEDNPIQTANAYTSSKCLAEELASAYSRDFGVSCVILRLFNVYGPGQAPPFLIPDILDSIVKKRMVVLRTPNSSRDFIYIDDVIDAFVKAADHKGEKFEVFNIGSGTAVSVMQIVNVIRAIIPWEIEVSIAPNVIDTISSLVSDCTKAHIQLNWKPVVSIEQGLSKIISGISLNE